MKKLNFLLLLFCCSLLTTQAFAQCSIWGPSTINNGNSANYSTSAGASYFWSVTGPFSIAGGNTNSSVNVTATGSPGSSGQVCVTRFLHNAAPCCQCKPISIPTNCIPASSVSITQGQACPGRPTTFTAHLSPSNATPGSYYWEVGVDHATNVPFFSGYSGSTLTVELPAGVLLCPWVSVTHTSYCDGSQVSRFRSVTVDYGCGLGGDLPPLIEGIRHSSPSLEVRTFPNPFKDFLTFELDYQQELDRNNHAWVELFDTGGKVVFNQRYELVQGRQTLQVNTIPQAARGVLYYRIRTQEAVLTTGELLRLE